jgi:hypothetical protein
MNRFIFSLLLVFCGAFASFAQKNPIVVPPSLHSPFYNFRNQRVGDSATRENTKTALDLLRKKCDNQLMDSDMMIIVHADSTEMISAEDQLKKEDADIKPIEELIKKLIRNSKGDPVLFRSPNGDLGMKVEHYFIENDRVYFWLSFENLNDPNTCHY